MYLAREMRLKFWTFLMFVARFPQKVPNVELAIYERNNGIGGTWFTNRFP